MELFFNLGLAWISVFAAIVLLLAYFTRKSIVIFPGVRKTFVKFNKALRKHHKIIGIILIVTALVHGLFSSEKVFSINLGTVSWIISILLGINWMLRKKLIKLKGWMFYHRLLVIVFSLSIVIHVVDVGGIQVFNVLKAAPVTSSEALTGSMTETTQPSETTEAITSGGKRHRGTDVSIQQTAEPTQTVSPTENIEPDITGVPIYTDGIFMGEAIGYRPGLVVSVEITDSEIASIEIVSHNEVGPRFYTTAMARIPQLIINEQSTDVDTISGATKTSRGIINAVEDALANASGD